MSFDDILPENMVLRDRAVMEGLDRMKARYGLDFKTNLDRIFHGETLYKTVEYMRKHR